MSNIQHLLSFFDIDQLTSDIQPTAAIYQQLAEAIVNGDSDNIPDGLPDGYQKEMALKKLLESRNYAIESWGE